MSYTIESPFQYFPDPTKFGTLGLGSLYVGIVNGSPYLVPAQRQQIYVAVQGGPDLPISQPVPLGAGGVPLYNGSPCTLKILDAYSIAVVDYLGAQVYYSPRNGDEITEIDNLQTQIDAIEANEQAIIESWSAIASTPASVAGKLFTLKQHTSEGLGGGTLISKAGSVTDDGGTKKNSATAGFYLERVGYAYVTSDMFGLDKTGATEVTTLSQTIVDNFPLCKFPAGTYLIDTLRIPANRKILTDGPLTIMQQKPQAGAKVFIVVAGSDVDIGTMTVRGNIATDTGEFNAGIHIAPGKAGVGNLRNIKVGDIYGVNTRGDVVQIEVVAPNTLIGCEIGNVDGNNTLRNVVTIAGGVDIKVGMITGSAVGFCHLDMEPEPTTAITSNVEVAGVKGRSVGVQSADAVAYIENVRIGMLDLSPSYATGTTPVYTPGLTLKSGLTVRNTKELEIDKAIISGFDDGAIDAIFNVGELGTEKLVINSLEVSNCALGAGKTDYISAGSIAVLDIGRLVASVSSGKNLISNGSVVRLKNMNCSLAASSSKLANACTTVEINNANISGTGNPFNNCGRLDVANMTAVCDYFSFGSGKSTFKNTTVTATTAVFDSSNDDHMVENCTLNTVYYRFGFYRGDYTAPFANGGYRTFVGTAGKVYIKSGIPTTNTDGTVVGTQT